MDDRRSDRSGTRQALTRRYSVFVRFLPRHAALPRAGRGVLFFVGLVILGCGEPPDTPQEQEVTVTIGVPESPGQGVGATQFARLLILEGLVSVGSDGHANPWLASGWAWEKDFTQLRLELRPGVFLHDGTPFDAELAAELLRQGVEDANNKALFPALNDIASITRDGDLNVVLTLSRTSPLLPADLGMQLRTGKDGMIGTGPYRLVSSSPEEVLLERFDRYYLGTATIPKVVVTPFDTLRTAWTSLLRGDVDFVSDVPADAVEFIRNDEVQVIPYARRYQFVIPFNARRGALRSPAVRKALNLAIDRQGLIKRALQGAGTPSSGPIWPEYWAYDKSMQPYGFDLVQAAGLLDDAGYRVQVSPGGGGPPARFRFTCLIPENFTVLERIGLEVQKSLLDIGVDMQLRAVSPLEFNKLIGAGDFDAILNDMNSGPTPGRPYVFWRSRRSFQGPYNVFGYENAEAERLFTAITRSINDAAVRSATGRLQQVLLNDPPALFLAWNTRARAVRRDFVIPAGADPIVSLWKWTLAPESRPGSTR